MRVYASGVLDCLAGGHRLGIGCRLDLVPPRNASIFAKVIAEIDGHTRPRLYMSMSILVRCRYVRPPSMRVWLFRSATAFKLGPPLTRAADTARPSGSEHQERDQSPRRQSKNALRYLTIGRRGPLVRRGAGAKFGCDLKCNCLRVSTGAASRRGRLESRAIRRGQNLALRLVAMGYTRVYWYRGGREAWKAAGLPEADLVPTDW